MLHIMYLVYENSFLLLREAKQSTSHRRAMPVTPAFEVGIL